MTFDFCNGDSKMAMDSLAYKDLRGYLDAVDKLGELRIVDGADWDLEVGAITEVAARTAKPKVVLFDNIKGYPKGFRVVTNPVCSPATTALAFGLDPRLTGLEIIRAWKEARAIINKAQADARAAAIKKEQEQKPGFSAFAPYGAAGN